MALSSGDPASLGDYELLDRLGSGGMGVVYLARSASGRQVAVKVVHAQFTEDEEFRTRFRQEVAAARRVSGAFTAPVVDADPDAERPWMATQYVSGPTLAERLAQHGPLDFAELRRLALGLAEALRDIHRAGVVHRDLKPANVLMAEDGPRVIDFGISRAGDNQALTTTGRVMGTPPFMSPEQLSRPREVTAASDVFSLGTLLVYAASGRGPFDAESPYMTTYNVVHEAPALDEVAEPLRGIVADCLAKDPTARPDLSGLLTRLRELPERGSPRVEGAAKAGSPAEAEEYAPTSPGRRRRRTLLAVLTAAVALGLGGGGLALYTANGNGVRTDEQSAAAQRKVSPPQGWRPWQVSLPRDGRDQLYVADDEVNSPACVREGDAFFCGGRNVRLVRVNGLTGHVDWRAKELVTAATPDEGTSVSFYRPLAVRGGLVYLHDSPGEISRRLVAVHADSGTVAWAHRVSGEEDHPTVLAGDMLVSTDPSGKALVARDAVTGDELWTSHPVEGGACTPTVADGLPYAICYGRDSDEGSGALLMRLDKRNGDAHRVTDVGGAESVLGAHDGTLLLGTEANPWEPSPSPAVSRVNPRTGERRELKLPANADGTPTLVGGRLFFVQETGRVTMVDPRSGKELWSTVASVEGLGAPTVSAQAGAVYLCGASGRLVALDLRTGAELWHTSPHSSVSGLGGAAFAVRGTVTGLTGDQTLFSVDPAHPDAQPSG
ncbi:protein kinase domain-containing protein [Streptomyces sp. P1-3]|uniref:serine/threonine-protein kinase n=1 Tax=Streptomyces sp. P1-3 TaxID=3421658 RepID=UPI003D366A47